MTPPTLDDVATLLLQLEPGDHDELTRAREQLADLAFGNRVSIAAQPLVARALKALKPLVDGTAAAPLPPSKPAKVERSRPRAYVPPQPNLFD